MTRMFWRVRVGCNFTLKAMISVMTDDKYEPPACFQTHWWYGWLIIRLPPAWTAVYGFVCRNMTSLARFRWRAAVVRTIGLSLCSSDMRRRSLECCMLHIRWVRLWQELEKHLIKTCNSSAIYKLFYLIICHYCWNFNMQICNAPLITGN